MKYVALIALAGVLGLSGETRKPVCNAKSRGQFWPESANVSGDARRQLYQTGELEMCSLEVWKYKWEHLSVNVQTKISGKPQTISPQNNSGDATVTSEGNHS